jgi:hypothetical protein
VSESERAGARARSKDTERERERESETASVRGGGRRVVRRRGLAEVVEGGAVRGGGGRRGAGPADKDMFSSFIPLAGQIRALRGGLTSCTPKTTRTWTHLHSAFNRLPSAPFHLGQLVFLNAFAAHRLFSEALRLYAYAFLVNDLGAPSESFFIAPRADKLPRRISSLPFLLPFPRLGIIEL